MEQFGVRNPAIELGIDRPGSRRSVRDYNLCEALLYEEAIVAREADLTAHGALTGIDRPTHRPFAEGQVHRPRATRPNDQIWWDNNKPMIAGAFRQRCSRICWRMARGRDLFVQDLRRRRRSQRLRPRTRVVTEFAWHSLFIRNLLIRPDGRRAGELRAEVDDHRPADASRADPERHGCPAPETVIAFDLVARASS